MEKTDIRVRFTRNTLRESLIALMKEKSILNITIKEICEHAGLSRSTFYTYYNDQYDLLRQIEEETLIESEKITQPYLGAERKLNGWDLAAILTDFLQFIAGNSNSIQVLLSKNGDSAFQEKFFRNGIGFVRQFREAAGIKPQNDEADKYGSAFWVSGALALVQ
ncbi:MAG: TetR/AcrR family transcriptional regulator, partial [Spirochaetaceae bacterium]|nr:TetR/AcrR family transcriptional regulator [Spirochaetaceae bacterium]